LPPDIPPDYPAKDDVINISKEFAGAPAVIYEFVGKPYFGDF
jgi:hypothetical protein